MMIDLTKLTSPKPPWLFRSALEQTLLSNALSSLDSSKGFVTRFANGSRMRTIDTLLTQFAKVLDFPDYFGHNSAALNDCLSDLAWLPARGYCIVITSSNELMADESDVSGEITWLVNQLNRTCQEWNVAVDEGEPWDRPATPFGIIFQSDVGAKTKIPHEIASLPTLILGGGAEKAPG